MSLLRLLPAQLSLLLLGALVLRMGVPLILVVPLLLLLMAAVLVPWSEVRSLMTGALGLGSLIWGFMTWARVQERVVYGAPWVRLALILGGVALFTAWSAWLLWPGRKPKG